MSVLEDRLRAELRAESQLITREAIPALSLSGPDGRRAAALRHRGPRRWPAWATPLAAAAAVTAVIVGTLTVSGLVSGGGPPRYAVTGVSYASLPPYYASTVEGSVVSYKWRGTQYGTTVLGRFVKIRATDTGKLIATISPPAPYNDFVLLTGTPDGRTFIFGAERFWGFRGDQSPETGALDASAPIEFVMVHIAADGHTELSALPLPFTILPGQQPSIALSPDGTRLAVAYGGGGQTALARVVTLATGDVRQWQWPRAPWTPLLQGQGAWTANGRTLVLQQWYVTRGANGKTPTRDTPADTTPTWLLDIASAGGTSRATSRLLVLRAPAGLPESGSPFITPDGRELVMAVGTSSRGLRSQSAGAFAVYSARTGALIRTQGAWTWAGTGRPGPAALGFPRPAVAWSDRSGGQLLIIQPRDSMNRLGVLTGSTVVLTGNGLLPSHAEGYAELQKALQLASGIPPSMTW